MELGICNNTKEAKAWEPKKMNVKFHKITSLHMKLSECYLCFHNSCEILHSFSLASLALEKCKKMQFSLNYSGTKFLSTEN